MSLDIALLAGSLLSIGLLVQAARMMGRCREERREVETRLREAEARNLGIMDGMAEGVITLHSDGTIVDLNSAALSMFGYERGELIGAGIEVVLVPKQHREELNGLMAHLRGLDDVRGFVIDAVALRKDGAERVVKVSFGAVHLGGQRVFTALIRDMTERKRISDALRASESQLRQITDALPALIAYVDADRRFQFHNKAYEEFFALNAQQVDGLTMREVLGEQVYAVLKPRVDEVLSGHPVRYEREHCTATGEVRDLSGQFIPRYGDGKDEGRVVGFYSLVTDISSLKRVNRMKSEFVSTVSHELRTPLTSIRGSLGLIAGGVAGPLPPAAHGLIDIAKNNCERLIRLINDLLDTEKIESGKMNFESEILDMRALAGQVLVANQGFAAQHGVSLELEPGPGPHVVGDADRLAQVVTNLVSNAAKFSPRGAAVTVSVTSAAGRVRVEVRDRGPGIAEEFRGRIFQKFSQADSSDSRLKGGTGLGLSISKAIVERLGGTIGFDTELGAGTTFHFDLPAANEAPQPIAAVGASPANASGGRILVCEDDGDIARLICMMLEHAGFSTDVACDAAQARQRLAANRYSAMTVDINLPDEDGISMIRALRADARTHGLPIVVVSANAAEGRIQVNNESLSVADWLEKPIDENRLVAVIRYAVEGMPGGYPSILHVEDDPDVRLVVAAIARDFAMLEPAGTLKEARARLAARSFDLILLDLDLPDGSGWSLLPDIARQEPRPPLVIFSATELAGRQGAQAQAVLVKARTSNEELAATLRRLAVPRSPLKLPDAA